MQGHFFACIYSAFLLIYSGLDLEYTIFARYTVHNTLRACTRPRRRRQRRAAPRRRRALKPAAGGHGTVGHAAEDAHHPQPRAEGGAQSAGARPRTECGADEKTGTIFRPEAAPSDGGKEHFQEKRLRPGLPAMARAMMGSPRRCSRRPRATPLQIGEGDDDGPAHCRPDHRAGADTSGRAWAWRASGGRRRWTAARRDAQGDDLERADTTPSRRIEQLVGRGRMPNQPATPVPMRRPRRRGRWRVVHHAHAHHLHGENGRGEGRAEEGLRRPPTSRTW